MIRCKRMGKRLLQQHREWQHTARCDRCKKSYTWDGKIRKGQVGSLNYVCGKCRRPMRVFNHRRSSHEES